MAAASYLGLNMTMINNPCTNLVKFPFDHPIIITPIQPMKSFTKKIRVSSHFSNSSTKMSSLDLNWRDIQGLNNWENLIQPLHPLLQREIIRYAKFVTACYDALDLNPSSDRYLTCKYAKNRLLSEVGWGDSGYDVTKYVYATPDICVPIRNGGPCARWVGYVAVSSDDQAKLLKRRDILVSFRGTVTYPEWIANFMSSLSPARLDPHDSRPDIKVESGFLSLYTSSEGNTRFALGSCREQLLSEISRLLRRYKNEELSITLVGHSMGSSLALLLGYDIAELGLNMPMIPLTVFSFAGPRVGNICFKERCEELGIKVLRIVNANDPVTKIPGVFLNESFRVFWERYEFPWTCACYAHVGIELVFDYLKTNDYDDNDNDDGKNEAIDEVSNSILDDHQAKTRMNDPTMTVNMKQLMDFFKIDDILCVHDMETYIELIKNCPTRSKIRRKRVDLMEKIKELTMSRRINMNSTSKWRDVAVVTCLCTMVGFVTFANMMRLGYPNLIS